MCSSDLSESASQSFSSHSLRMRCFDLRLRNTSTPPAPSSTTHKYDVLIVFEWHEPHHCHSDSLHLHKRHGVVGTLLAASHLTLIPITHSHCSSCWSTLKALLELPLALLPQLIGQYPSHSLPHPNPRSSSSQHQCQHSHLSTPLLLWLKETAMLGLRERG